MAQGPLRENIWDGYWYAFAALLVITPWLLGPVITPGFVSDKSFLAWSEWSYGLVGAAGIFLATWFVVIQWRGRCRGVAGGVERVNGCKWVFVVYVPWFVLGLVLLGYIVNASDLDLGYGDRDRLVQTMPMIYVPWGIGGHTVLSGVLYVLGAMALYASLSHVRVSAKAMKRVLFVLLGNSALVILVGIALEILSAKQLLGFVTVTNSSFFGPFQYHNYFVGYTIVQMFLGVGLLGVLLETHGRQPTRGGFCQILCCGFLICIHLLALPVSGSRSGMLLGSVSFLLVLLLIIRWCWCASTTRKRTKGRALRRGLLWVGAAVGCVLVLLIIAYGAGRGEIDRRLADTKRQADKALEAGQFYLPGRGKLHEHTVAMIADRPVWGYGPGSWQQVFPAYASEQFIVRRPYHVPSKYCERTKMIGNAHHDWLELIQNLGIVGFLLLLSVPLWQFARQVKIGLTRLQKAILPGLILAFILGFVDAPLIHPANLLAALLAFAICSSDLSKKVPGQRRLG